MKHKNILVIEDDYLDVISLQRALSKMNIEHTLHVAHNGEEALDMLTGTSDQKLPGLPDLMFLDINMPKMNGLEFLRIIRNYFTLKSIPVFIMTTSLEEYDLNEAKKLAISGYLVKPLDLERHKGTTLPDGVKRLVDLLTQ
jgi:CheY-like chemotaxis protein